MQKSKLLILLKSLSKEEFRRFYKFVQSPWFNTNKGVIQLYEYLRPYYPSFDSSKLTKELAFQKIFPGEPYLDTRMRTLISLLRKGVEDYLVELEFEKEPVLKKNILVEAISKRDLYPFFIQLIEDLLNSLDHQSQRDMDYYQTKMRWHQSLFFHPQTSKYSLDHHHLQETVKHLDQFYLLAKLRFTLEMVNRKKILAVDFDNFMLAEILDKINDPQIVEDYPVVGLYMDILNLHEYGQNDELLKKVKQQLEAHAHLLSISQLQVILTNLINHTIQVYNTGAQAYLDHQFELYQFSIDKDLILEDGRISEATFTNIVVIGSILKKFEWVEEFIPLYVAYLDPAISEQAQNLGEAYLYYHQGDYDSTIGKLMNVPFVEVTYGFRARGLLLRTYFEYMLKDVDYYDLLQSHLSSFRKYLKRNPTIGQQRKEAYTNLISLTQKLAIILIEKFSDEGMLKQLREKAIASSPVITKTWIIDKIDGALGVV